MKPSSSGSGSDSSVIRYTLATLLTGLCLYFLYEVVAVSRAATPPTFGSLALPTANASVKSHRVCNAPKSGTKIVKIYPTNSKFSLSMYTFLSDDLSTEVQAHAASKGRMAGSAFHTFYEKELCTPPVPVSVDHSSNSSNSNSSTEEADATPHPTSAPHCSGIVLDIGAFIGTQALVLAKMGFHVHAFEPQAGAAELLRCSSLMNKLLTLRVIQEGMSDAMGEECLLYPMAKLAHQAMMAPKSHTNMSCDPSAMVPVVTLDHYWRDVLDKQQIRLITMDAEGHEELIFTGGQQLFSEAPPHYMILDYDPKALGFKGSTPDSFLKSVDKAGYLIYDCQSDVYVSQGRDGEAVLDAYKSKSVHTSLLLVHKQQLNGTKPTFICDV